MQPDCTTSLNIIFIDFQCHPCCFQIILGMPSDTCKPMEFFFPVCVLLCNEKICCWCNHCAFISGVWWTTSFNSQRISTTLLKLMIWCSENLVFWAKLGRKFLVASITFIRFVLSVYSFMYFQVPFLGKSLVTWRVRWFIHKSKKR